ncbi:MAG: TolC family protein [Planctomycetes bacterium]|nr:TolC family protein [Planctomycetota bacterium]
MPNRRRLRRSLALVAATALWHGYGLVKAGEQPQRALFIIREGPRSTSVQEQISSAFKPVTVADFSDEGPALPLTLRDVVAAALEGNNDIRVASHRPDQARAGITEAMAAYEPEAFADWQRAHNSNPASVASGRNYDSSYTNDTERMGVRQHLPSGGTVMAYREWNQGSERHTGYSSQRGSGGAFVLEFSQPLLNGFADRENRAIIEISRMQLDISEEELRLTAMQVVAESIETYWTVALALEEVRIHEDTLAMAQTLLDREIERQGKGISTPLDVHRASEAVATRTTNLFVAREQLQAAQERLKLLLNTAGAPIGGDTRIVPAEDLESRPVRADVVASIERALLHRPEARNADLAIRASEVRRKYARHNLLPQLNVGGSVRRNDRRSTTPTSTTSTDTLGTDWTLGVSLSMPIGNVAPRATLRRAESELSQSIDEKRNIRNVIMTEVKTAVHNLTLSTHEIPISAQAAEAARKVVEGEWARFELNQVGNRDLLQAQDLLSVAERSRVQSLVKYNVNLVRLLAAEGTLLDHLGVAVK